MCSEVQLTRNLVNELRTDCGKSVEGVSTTFCYMMGLYYCCSATAILRLLFCDCYILVGQLSLQSTDEMKLECL